MGFLGILSPGPPGVRSVITLLFFYYIFSYVALQSFMGYSST